MGKEFYFFFSRYNDARSCTIENNIKERNSMMIEQIVSPSSFFPNLPVVRPPKHSNFKQTLDPVRYSFAILPCVFFHTNGIISCFNVNCGQV